MSPQATKSRPKRQKLLQEAATASYQASNAAILFHTATAKMTGLSPIEEKTLVILTGLGPLSVGEIGRYIGLTSGSVTNLVDRLEAKRYAKRTPDPDDVRRLRVVGDEAQLAKIAEAFHSIQGVEDELFENYTDEQLETIVDYLNRSSQRALQAMEKLREILDKK